MSRDDNLSGGRTKKTGDKLTRHNHFPKVPKGQRWWKAGRKPVPYEEKGRHTTVRVPAGLYGMSLVCGGLSGMLRVLWSMLQTDPELMERVKAEAKLYYPYAGDEKS